MLYRIYTFFLSSNMTGVYGRKYVRDRDNPIICSLHVHVTFSGLGCCSSWRRWVCGLATLPHSHYKFPSKWNKNDPIIIHYLETIKSALSAGGRGLIRYLDYLANVIEWMLMSSLVVTVFVCWKFPYYMH